MNGRYNRFEIDIVWRTDTEANVLRSCVPHESIEMSFCVHNVIETDQAVHLSAAEYQSKLFSSGDNSASYLKLT